MHYVTVFCDFNKSTGALRLRAWGASGSAGQLLLAPLPSGLFQTLNQFGRLVRRGLCSVVCRFLLSEKLSRQYDKTPEEEIKTQDEFKELGRKVSYRSDIAPCDYHLFR
ncbi:hypothetical protein AVEN_151771-1 [Araneus ventricosus]|uniref:Uncharacterized protein n=1 Tax=Araneus ventricosus TaxID=182803 RepID=A0A4Y2IV68_ARAVE|nr:hypothetical protein AVEN_151771-1 [Araneus ventricosus]